MSPASNDHPGSQPSLPKPKAPEAVPRDLRQELARARAALAQGYEQGSAVARLLADFSAVLDGIVRDLFAGAGVDPETLLTLVALGSWGREEPFPHSDLDLLVLHEGVSEPAITRLVEVVVYPLWEAGLRVNHAVRDQEQTLELASQDLTVCTSLLDARLLGGHEGLFHALRAASLRRFFGPSGEHLIVRLRKERAERHRRFGDTVYLLEPNVKSGRGGLRDLATGLWAAKARLGLLDLDELDREGGASPRQERTLVAAQEFLRTLRLAMHLHTGRQVDQLTFELQEALAPRLFPEEPIAGLRRPTPAVAPAVERLMRAYYRHARAVVVETEGILERLALLDQPTLAEGTPASADPDEHLEQAGGRLRSRSPERFFSDPSQIIRAFLVSLEMGLPLDRPTRDTLSEAAAREPGLALPAESEAAEFFLRLLTHPEAEGRSTVLEEVHDQGVLAALIPEFEACTGRVQHDLYHVYTVDLHSLYVVGLLKSWLRGEQGSAFPMPVAVASGLASTEVLLLSALLHDMAKPLGRSHARRGARLARGVAARLGLSGQAIADLAFLVQHHLTMAHLSQRRDLTDPSVIAQLCDLVRGDGRTDLASDLDRLRGLYLLTAADTAMTSPGNLNEWKARLLDELYMRAYSFLVHGKSVSLAERQRRAAGRQAALEAVLLRRHGERGAALARRLPPTMLLNHSEEELLHVLDVPLVLAEPGGLPAAIRVRPLPDHTVELTVGCSDSAGRLATITGVMLAHRIEVLGAQVYTLEPPSPGESATVLDIFTVKAPSGSDDELFGAFAADLSRALQGELDVPSLVERLTRPSPLGSRVVPRVPTEVAIDNEGSSQFSVVEILTQDRLGVLHAITRCLSTLGLSIHLSRVATEAGRVVDVFYVRDERSGGKLDDPARQEEVRAALVQALAFPDRSP